MDGYDEDNRGLDMTRIIGAFHDFAKAPDSILQTLKTFGFSGPQILNDVIERNFHCVLLQRRLTARSL
jgi:hypothetical protein